MYKYTYLLSDSYREKATTNQRQTKKPISQNERTIFTRNSSSNCYCRPINYQSAKDCNYKNQNMKFSSVHQKYLISLQDRSKRRSISSTYDPQMSVSDRIQRLSDLSDRHQQALREVDLQTKLKQITNKYANKRRPQQTHYFNSKKQLDVRKMTAHSRNQQNYSNLLTKNKNNTVYQPRFDKNQYNYRKQQKVQDQMERTEAVSKLTSLQERIRLSIDKLH